VKVYLVGGAVRDQLLGLPVKERDWLVVGATPEEMLAKGFRRADAEFPVFLHPESGEEYALARTEVKTGAGYKGFRVESGPEVALDQDLRRRDLTINALARDESGEIIDPWGGREDLEKGLLRHITPAFSEDPVRLLRVARFAAKLGHRGFRVAHATHALMREMAVSPDLHHLKPERIWREMERAMGESQPWRFFEVLHRCGALAGVLPALDRGMGEEKGFHAAVVPAPAVQALRRAVASSEDPVVRTAVVLFDAAAGEADTERWFGAIRAGRKEAGLLRDLLSARDTLATPAQAASLLRLAGGLKSRQQPQRLERFLLAAAALWPEATSRWEPGLRLAGELLCAKPGPAAGLEGLQGAALGAALQAWREARLREALKR